MDRVVGELVKAGQRDLKPIIRRLVMREEKDTVRNCIAAVTRYVQSGAQRRQDTNVVKARTSLFGGKHLRSFALGIIVGDVFGRGRLHAAVKLDFYVISPFILVDAIFLRFDSDALKTAARMSHCSTRQSG